MVGELTEDSIFPNVADVFVLGERHDVRGRFRCLMGIQEMKPVKTDTMEMNWKEDQSGYIRMPMGRNTAQKGR